MSDIEDEMLANTCEKVWAKGDKCEARWEDDGKYYPGIVQGFVKEGNKKLVAIKFKGFEDYEDEELSPSQLRIPTKKCNVKSLKANPSSKEDKPKANSLFSPLKGDEDNTRLCNKYKFIEEDKELVITRTREPQTPSQGRRSTRNSQTKTPGSSAKKRKGIVAFGGQAKSTPPLTKRERAPSKTPILETNDTTQGSFTLLQYTGESIHDSDTPELDSGSGFSDEDQEKPRFPGAAPQAKVPLVLSEGADLVQVPGTINRYLRDYQRDGVRFLYKHYQLGEGAILGDDMGLGKTVQVIAFMAAVLGKTGTKADLFRQRPSFIRRMSSTEEDDSRTRQHPFLMIGPATVLYNWVDELETWGHFTVGRYHGAQKEQTVADLRRRKLDVVLTTFETCRDNIETINQFEWTAIIADEAHRIKGLKAEVTHALKSLQCLKRYGLTGTPLQNNLYELWCIMDWANPGCLQDLTLFKHKYIKMIELGQRADATKRELAAARKAQETLAKVRSQWMLRRTKDLIADEMPKKEELVVYCKTPEFQQDIYKTILAQDDMKLILTQNHECPCNSGYTRGKCCFKKNEDGVKVKSLTFTYLHLLLKAANHIALLLPDKTTSEGQKEYAKKIATSVLKRYPQFLHQSPQAAYRTLSDVKYCGKMKVLTGLMSVMRKKRSKILLFSYSTKLLDILEQYIMCKGYEYRRLDGQTPMKKRVDLVREYNSDPNIFIFLISTKAGGLGLNLTAANTVIIYDPNWNPTHDLQAQDRAYRLGQRRDVKVYRLITSGTIEENIYLRQVYKQQLDKVAVETENAKRYFHKGELFGLENMFTFRAGDRCMTEDILKRHSKVEEGLKTFKIEEYVPSEVEKKLEEERESENNASHVGENIEEVNSDDENDVFKELLDLDEDSRGTPLSTSTQRSDKSTQSKTTDNQSTHHGNKSRANRLAGRQTEPDSDYCSDDNTDTNNRTCKKSTDKSKIKNSKKTINKEKESSSNMTENVTGMPGKASKRKSRVIESSDSDSTPLKKKQTSLKTSSAKVRKKVLFSESLSEEDEEMKPRSSRMEFPQTFQSVSDVFSECGVIHTHQNKKIVGASRAEDHMTKCALQDVYELNQNSQVPAEQCAPLSDSDAESDDLGTSHKESNKAKSNKSKNKDTKSPTQPTPTPILKKPKPSTQSQRSAVINNKKVLIGQTPRGIRKKQFAELAKAAGEPDILEFARNVLLSSREYQHIALKQFYTQQDDSLSQLFIEPKVDEVEHATESVPKKKGRPKKPSKPTKKLPAKAKRKTVSRKGADYGSSDEEVEQEREQRKWKKSKTSRPPIKSEPEHVEIDDINSEDTRVTCDTKSPVEYESHIKTRTPTKRKPDKSPGKRIKVKDPDSFDSDSCCDSEVVRKFRPKRKRAEVQYDSESELDNDISESKPLSKSSLLDLGTNTLENESIDDVLDDIFGDCDSIHVKKTPKKTPKKSRNNSSSVKTPRNIVESRTSRVSRRLDVAMSPVKKSKLDRAPNDSKSGRVSAKSIPDKDFDPDSFLDDIFFDDFTNKTENTENAETSKKSAKRHVESSAGDFDLFGDSELWVKKTSPKKRRNMQTMAEELDSIIDKDNSEYEKMFRSGKLKKKHR